MVTPLLRRRASRWLILGGLAVPFVLPSYYQYLVTELIIWGVLAMSLDLLIGYTGLPSFGHAVFFGLPAYTYGIVATGSGSIALGLAAALGSIAAVGTLVGYFATRTGGVGYIIVTLLASFAMFVGIFSWTKVTGGDNGLYLSETLSLARTPTWMQYLLVLCAGGVLWALARRVTNSGFGLVLRGIKANERRMQAIGYNTSRVKLQVTLVSAAMAGCAGILYALIVQSLSADLVGPELSTQVVMWVLLGGIQTLIGPLIGAALFILLTDILNTVNAYPLILGLVFVGMVVWAPEGLARLRVLKPAMKSRGTP